MAEKPTLPNSTLSEEQLKLVEQTTLSHYNNSATSFWNGTKDHDVSQNYAALLAQFDESASLHILDFGCGPGRDVSYFKSLGHKPIGLDGSFEFCEMARKHTGCEILCQSFLDLNLEEAKFDAIFANASLFHVPKQKLSQVLSALHCSLKPGGILFSSNPRGNSEGISNGRYGNFMEFEEASACLSLAGFNVLNHYYRPEGLPIEQQPWLAIVSKRI
ncbi:MAG: class I SAM-dependent methyltransferase [Saccharospirillaceae bacterium]|nr:class I SAM-dependent methyltransferase [Pseudomonadales bacterium]NRB79606.1 class I SAM-dependent methyltransferase [Saccharospirillaceae bacterium]